MSVSNLEGESRNMSGPPQDLQGLGRLVGTWTVSGGVTGSVVYEWMAGQFFLIQHLDLTRNGVRMIGMEVIGHVRHPGTPPDEQIRSRFYDNAGNTNDFVYELAHDTLTIWGGDKGSPVYCRATFSDDGDTLTGTWVYPDGGGYESTMSRQPA